MSNRRSFLKMLSGAGAAATALSVVRLENPTPKTEEAQPTTLVAPKEGSCFCCCHDRNGWCCHYHYPSFTT